MSFTDLDRFNVRIFGAGETTVVLAHGYGSNQDAWENQVAILNGNYRVVLFDHIGCGKLDVNDYDPSIYSDLNFHRDNIISIYDALDLKKTIFIGHSVSSMLGIGAYLARPELFERMVFISGSPCYLNKEDYQGGFDREDINRLYSAMSADFFKWANGFGKAAGASTDCPSLGEYFAARLSSMRPEVAQSVARAIFELDYRSHLEKMTLPVLILQARNDIAVPIRVAEYMHAKTPNSRLVLLDAEGHLPHLSAPRQVNQAILDFLDQSL
jgi:sigma-B regulation protein RsbQ